MLGVGCQPSGGEQARQVLAHVRRVVGLIEVGEVVEAVCRSQTGAVREARAGRAAAFAGVEISNARAVVRVIAEQPFYSYC